MSERITLVEIDIKRCSLTYGQGACTANGDPCFNSYATCQVKPAYSETVVTSCYSTPTNSANPESDCLPSLVSVSERPAMLALGESIGTRASMSATFADHPYPDTGPEGDYYLSQRSYNPIDTGTYWGKFRARYPFMQGWAARVLQGTTNQSPAQMETRHFIVDTFSGPDSSGRVTLVMKDALKLADSQKSQAPVISIGALSTDINSTATSITLTPIGAGDSYPARGVLAIGGDEIVTYSGRSGDTLTGIVRGRFNTVAVEHTAGARVQLCLQYTAQKVTAIIRDLLVNYARVPASYIPLASWTDEDDTYIQRQYSSLIAEPTPVNDLINELLEQTASTVWWDDYSRLMRFRVLRAVESGAALYDDDIIKADSFSSEDQNDKRVSQVWTYYGQINPLEDQDDPSNYSRSQVTISPESEQNFGGTPAIKRIYSRWITETGADAAQRLNLLILSRYTTPPRLLSWSLQRNPSLVVPELGAGYRVASWTMQEPTGETSIVPAQVVQIKTTESDHRVTAEEVLYSETVAPDDPNVKTVNIDSSRLNMNLYDEALAAPFLPPQAGDTWIFTVAPGVVIGSSSTSTFAVDTDNRWPAGVTIRLVISAGAYVVGRGGAGGSAFASSFGGGSASAGNGSSGGDALRALVPIEIDNAGVIGGGGGGGGGAAALTKIDGIVEARARSRGADGAPSASDPLLPGPDPVQIVDTAGPTVARAKGGTGGTLGQPGTAGTASASGGDTNVTRTGTGGAPGAAVVGNANITWINTGTRLGPTT